MIHIDVRQGPKYTSDKLNCILPESYVQRSQTITPQNDM